MFQWIINQKNKKIIQKKIINIQVKKNSEDIKIDMESIGIFKKEIYNIERAALVPMRECIPYTKDIAKI